MRNTQYMLVEQDKSSKLQFTNSVIFGKSEPQLSYLQAGDNNTFQMASQSFYENQLEQYTYKHLRNHNAI